MCRTERKNYWVYALKVGQVRKEVFIRWGVDEERDAEIGFIRSYLKSDRPRVKGRKIL